MTTAEIAPRSSDTEIGAVHMIRADLDIREFHRWAGGRSLIGRSAFDEGFAMHCLLVESFGELAPKPFRVITPRGQRRRTGTLYSYSDSTADDLKTPHQDTAIHCRQKYCPPRISTASRCPLRGEWDRSSASRFWFARLSAGQEVPIDRAVETDAFQAEAELHPRGGMRRSREEVYTDWLRTRLEGNGATRLEDATLSMFQRVRTVRKLHTRASEGPHAVMHGSLTVTDASAFSRMLAHGVGRHKAYGYGMLLLRPPRS